MWLKLAKKKEQAYAGVAFANQKDAFRIDYVVH
jgi:hypothetical protein